MKSIRIKRRKLLKFRKPLKKIVTLPVNFTGALLADTGKSGVVIIVIVKGTVQKYTPNIDSECKNPKEYIRKAEQVLEEEKLSHLTLYEWENAGDNFDQLMFVYGGKLNPKMSCVK